MNSISFVNVYLLFIALPLAALLTVPFVLAVKRDNLNGHNIASLVLHILMAALIAFAAAGTQFVTVMTETDVYVVADVSYSANKNLDTLDNYVRNVGKALPKNSRMGVVCFGKDYKLVTRLGENFRTVRNSGVDDSETDIENALDYTGTLFRDTVLKRIVLITDGKDTNSSDSNTIKRAVDNLKAQNIKVDAIYLNDNISADAKEVQVTSVEYSGTVYLNHGETATALVQSSYACNATLSLYRDGQKVEEQDKAVALTAGSNRVSFDLKTDETGTYGYEIRIAAQEDENTFNNACSFTQTVSGAVKVLFISQDFADLDEARKLFGEDVEVDYFVNDPAVPCSVEALCKYDEIYISNADVSLLNNSALFMESLETAVSMFGKSLITLGDTSIQNKNDSELRDLQNMLPVNYGNSGSDKKLYTIVIDGSRSMEFNNKLQIVKRAACNLIDLLEDRDSVCVVVFHGNVETAQRPVQVGLNREAIKQTINDISVTQGTFIGLGLSEALNWIRNESSNFTEMQLMLMSDGLNYTQETTNDARAIVKQLRAYGVVTSVLDVGRGRDNSSVAVAAKELLNDLSKYGDGEYYPVSQLEDVDDVIFGDVADTVKETKIERFSWVDVKRRFDETLEGLDNLSYIAGFMNSSVKPSATTVLTTEYQNASGIGIEVPIYAYRTYGNGKVASFTSSISGDWLSAWEQSGIKSKFFKNVLSALTPNVKADYPYTVELAVDTGTASVTVTPAVIRAGAVASIEVTSPDGQTLNGNLVFESVAYGYTFSAQSVGRYDIAISYSYGGQTYTAHTGFTVSYLPEYDSFAVYDASGLHHAVGAEGTVSEDGNITIENDPNEVSSRTVTLTVPLLAICVALFAVDIIVRKLKGADIKSLFKKVK